MFSLSTGWGLLLPFRSFTLSGSDSTLKWGKIDFGGAKISYSFYIWGTDVHRVHKFRKGQEILDLILRMGKMNGAKPWSRCQPTAEV